MARKPQGTKQEQPSDKFVVVIPLRGRAKIERRDRKTDKLINYRSGWKR